MQKWYDSINRKQQYLVILVSLASIPIFVGIALTPVAIYLELGRNKDEQK